jgi:biopolymer transport protein ExbD
MKALVVPDESIGFQMAPMIDIVFLLIIFFMVSANITQTAKIKLDMPESAEARAGVDQSDRFTVSVTPDGAYFVGARMADLPSITQEIRVLQKSEPNLRLVIRADRKTPHGPIKALMAGCAEAGISNIIFAAHEK